MASNNSKLDDNRNHTMQGVTNDANAETRNLLVDAATDRLLTSTTGTVTAELSATDNAVLDDIAANQTDASQKTQVVDGSGNVIGATANALDVNIKSGGAGDGAILDGASASIKASVFDYTNSNPLAVRLTNTDGDYVSAGAGTQYTEADTDASISGTAILMEGAGDALVPVQGTAADGVLVNLGSNNDITGTVTANAGTNLNTSALALETGGNLATIAGDTTSIDGKITACNTGAIAGTVTANLSATDNAVLDQIELNTDPLLVVGGGTEATAQRVTIANDSTGVISVDDNGGALTVDGTVAVTQGTATNLKAQAECYQGGSAVAAGNPLQVSVANTGANGTAIKVNVASGGIASGAIASGAIASGAIAAGAIAAGNTSIATTEDTARAAGEHLVKVGCSRLDTPVANANVGTDGDYTNLTCDNFGKLWTAGSIPEDTAHVAGEAITVMGERRIDAPATSAGTSGDWATANQDALGRSWVHPTPNEMELAGVTTHVKKYYTNAGAVTDGIIWSPAAGKRWYVTDIFINVSAAATVTLEDDLTGGDSAVWKAELAANSGWSHSFTTPLYSGEDAADLIITTSAGNVYVTVTGYEV